MSWSTRRRLIASAADHAATASGRDASGRPRVSRHDSHQTSPAVASTIQLQPHAALRQRQNVRSSLTSARPVAVNADG